MEPIIDLVWDIEDESEDMAISPQSHPALSLGCSGACISTTAVHCTSFCGNPVMP